MWKGEQWKELTDIDGAKSVNWEFCKEFFMGYNTVCLIFIVCGTEQEVEVHRPTFPIHSQETQCAELLKLLSPLQNFKGRHNLFLN